jgi:ribosomal protein S18 acetylase RimI-like enzyme
MKHRTRPDGRCFVVGEPDEDLPSGRLYATADEADEARLRSLQRLGFAPHRRELLLELPTDPARWSTRAAEPLPGITCMQADAVDEEQLRLLDDALRQDVPGTDGWEWGADDFHNETYSPGFDPATYLVAVDRGGSYLGIARVWMRQQPRLGFIGVRPERRRQGIARALLADVLTEVHRRGVSHVRTEVDETNVASRMLLAGFGGKSVGAALELVKPA